MSMHEIRWFGTSVRCAGARAGARGVIVLLAAVAGIEAARAEPAPAVEITPNAILQPSEPMEIEVTGSPGTALHLFILRNCDNDWSTPEATPRPGCDPRVLVRQVRLDQRGRWRQRLPMAEVPSSLHGQPLWVRVSTNVGGQWPHGDAIFTVVSDPCSVWDTFIGLFTEGPCRADVQKTIRPQRGSSSERPGGLLEVKRIERDPSTGAWGRLTAVPGTRGATGATWADAHALLVTVDAVAGGDGAEPPGLYRIDVETGRRRSLAAPREGEILTAPFAVTPDQVVFVRERVVTHSDGTVAVLAMWRRGRVTREIPLRVTIHQILAADPARSSVLAYSRWQGVPALLQIDLRTGAVTHLGFPEQLVHAALREPGGSTAVLALPDNAGDNGWDLVLVDARGRLAEELAVGPDDALMPAWHPGGGEIVHLGQVKESVVAP